MSFSRKTFAACLLSLILFLPTGNSKAEPILSDTVRVLVAQDQKLVYLSVRGEYQVYSLPDLKLMKQGKKLSKAAVVSTSRGIKIGSEEWAVRSFRIIPKNSNDLVLNKSKFRGALDILKTPQGSLYAINRLNIEDYLYGVLHYEVAAWWPMNALKAQAVAARTYALYQVSVSKAQEYDLKSSTSSQVYGGSTKERYRTKKAVDLTKGEILMTPEGKIFPAYFHATCAGKTAAANELWKITEIPLRGGALCNYCKISPHYDWSAKVLLADIEERLKKYGKPLGQILRIEIISQTPSGRVGSLRLTGTMQDFVIAAKDFRIWVGGDKIRSTRFSVTIQEDVAIFKGTGWGHGVGLCQWGALGQSLLGKRHAEILQFYYPESKILQNKR